MFFVRYAQPEHQGREGSLVRLLEEEEVLTYPPEGNWARFVTHNDVSDEGITRACCAITAAAEGALYS